MDHEFRDNETGTDPEDTKYENWIAAVGHCMKREIEIGSQLESDLFDYYKAAYTSQQAAAEFMIAESVEARERSNEKCDVTIINRNGVSNTLKR